LVAAAKVAGATPTIQPLDLTQRDPTRKAVVACGVKPMRLPHYKDAKVRKKLEEYELIGAIMATIARLKIPQLASPEKLDTAEGRSCFIEWLARHFQSTESRRALQGEYTDEFHGGKWSTWKASDIATGYKWALAYCRTPTSGDIAAAAADASAPAVERRKTIKKSASQ
jgi:hypothetical protein